jgi:hypothetical protein
MRLSIPILRDLRLNLVLFTPSPLLLPITTRIKMKANDILTSSETNTDEAIALGIDISKTANYKEGQLVYNK